MTFHNFTVADAIADSGTGYAPEVTRAGTNFPVKAMRYADGVTTYNAFYFKANDYSGSNLSIDIDWYSPSASGAVAWQAEVAAITPNVDTISFESKGFGTAMQGVGSSLGGAGRLRRTTITLSTSGTKNNLAEDDFCVLKVSRIGASGADTLASEVLVPMVGVSY